MAFHFTLSSLQMNDANEAIYFWHDMKIAASAVSQPPRNDSMVAFACLRMPKI